MSRRIVGTLSAPDGTDLASTTVSITAIRNDAPGILKGSSFEFTTDGNGGYDETLENGIYRVAVMRNDAEIGIGNIEVTSGDDTTITALLITFAGTSDPMESALQQLLDDAVNAAAAAEDARDAAIDAMAGKAADSDKLDGLDSSQFLRSDESGTIEGSLVVETDSTSGVSVKRTTGTGYGGYGWRDENNVNRWLLYMQDNAKGDLALQGRQADGQYQWTAFNIDNVTGVIDFKVGAKVLGSDVWTEANFDPDDYLALEGDSVISGNVRINGTDSIGGSDFNNGWLRIGNDQNGLAMDSSEMYFATGGILANFAGNLSVRATSTLQLSGSGSNGLTYNGNQVWHEGNPPSVSEVEGLQSALNGKVDDSQVLTDVPAGAVFTDTTYSNAQIKSKYEANGNTNAYTDAEKSALANRGTAFSRDAVGSGDVYARGGIVGTVSQSGGTPTGAIIQRGSNANGEFTKYADGAMECWAILTATYSSAGALQVTWTFPSTFASGGYVPSGAVNYDSFFGSVSGLSPRDLAVMFARTFTNSSCNFILFAQSGSSFSSGDESQIRVRVVGRWY